MAKSRAEAFRDYHRTGRNNSNYDLNDYDEIAALTGWKCARNERRAEAFRQYNRDGVNHSNFDLTDRDEMNSILRNK